MKLLIVGAGAMGRWFARSVDADVAFADADPDAADEAAEAADGRVVALDADERFDAVCFAVPMATATEAIAAHAEKAERALFDVTGAMAEPVEAMAEHAPDVERASLHPLFGPDNAPGNVAVVRDEPGPVVDEVLSTLEARGNVTFDTTPAEHDRAMETVQSRTHAAVLAFALAADEVPEQFHTPVFADLRRLADHVTDGNPRVYREIQEMFDGAGDVADAARRIADADPEGFERLYREAGER